MLQATEKDTRKLTRNCEKSPEPKTSDQADDETDEENECNNRQMEVIKMEDFTIAMSVQKPQKKCGLFSCLSLLIGSMIGSGIFVSPKGVTERLGCVPLSLLVWGGSGLLSLLTALCYAELGCTLATRPGAEHVYLLEAFGPLPAFLFAWISALILKPATLAILCLTFSEYVIESLSCNCPPSPLLVKMLTAISIGAIAFINCYSHRAITNFQKALTLIKLTGVLIIIGGGITKLTQGHTLYLSMEFKGSTSSEMATAFYHGLWAYDGWNNLNYVTDEIQNPQMILPRTAMIGIPVVIILYLLLNVSYFTVMTSAEVIASDGAMALTWASRVFAQSGVTGLSILVAACTIGAGTISGFTAGRLAYVAAREGHLAEFLSYVHVRRLTPLPALVFNGVIATCMAMAGSKTNLIHIFGFTAWLFYGTAISALIIMRYTKRNLPRPFKVPLVIPLTVLIASFYLVIAPLVEKPCMEYFYAALLLAIGLLLYVPMVYYKSRRLNGKITSLLQLLLEVGPTQYAPE